MLNNQRALAAAYDVCRSPTCLLIVLEYLIKESPNYEIRITKVHVIPYFVKVYFCTCNCTGMTHRKWLISIDGEFVQVEAKTQFSTCRYPNQFNNVCMHSLTASNS